MAGPPSTSGKWIGELITSNEPVVYFHGMPGSPRELQMFSRFRLSGETLFYAPDRRSSDAGLGLSGHFDRLAAEIDARFSHRAVRFVGFSLGAYVALEVASRMGDRVRHINLVSAAAPLGNGVHLNKMAGKTIFRIARRSPFLFAAIARAQSFASRMIPARLCDALLASARGDDRHLADQPEFRAAMAGIVTDCIGDDTSNYRREIAGYVADWSAILPSIRQPVTLWHGSSDNWAPPEMARMLADALPTVAALNLLESKSHYSALHWYLSNFSGRQSED